MTATNLQHRFNSIHANTEETNLHEEVHLFPSWEQDVLCAIIMNLGTCLIGLPHLAYWIIDKMCFLISNLKKEHIFTKLVWYSTLSNDFGPIRLIIVHPDRNITNICLNVWMRLFFLSHASAANPTMTTICRQEASACTVDAMLAELPLWQTFPQILFPKHFYLWLQKRGEVWRVSLCLLPVCFPKIGGSLTTWKRLRIDVLLKAMEAVA